MHKLFRPIYVIPASVNAVTAALTAEGIPTGDFTALERTYFTSTKATKACLLSIRSKYSDMMLHCLYKRLHNVWGLLEITDYVCKRSQGATLYELRQDGVMSSYHTLKLTPTNCDEEPAFSFDVGDEFLIGIGREI